MAGYIRQSSFVDGDTITAALFNNEFNQMLNAFSNTGGHKHDGTAAEGPVIGLIGDAGETAPNNKVLIDTTNNFIEFYVQVSSNPVQQLYIADGAIIPVTDSDVDLGTTSLRFKDTYTDTITTTGNVSVGGNLTVTGTTTFNGGTITMGDAATDNVVFGADIDSNIIPDDDNTYDLGSTSQEWRNLYIDGTANIDSLVADTADINGGTVDGAIIGGSSAAAITGTTITGTSFVIGSADISEAELETIDGVTAGTVAASKAVVVDANKDIGSFRNITLTGELDAGSLDVSGNVDVDGTLETDALSINGTTVTSTAAELNILDGVTSTAAELNILDGVTSTAAELNILDGVTASAADINLIDGITNGTVIASKAIITDANIDITGGRNITISGELDAATLDISGDADIDGTLEADAITIGGVTLAETISDTVGAMVSSNTESGITVAYDDADNTLDFTVGTLNQNTTGSAATLTTARTIGGVSFNGSANIDLPGVNTAGNQNTSGTAAIATTVTITDNESTNENNAVIFTAGGDLDGGNLGLESDGDLYYNPSTGTLTVPNVSVSGTFSTVNSVTMDANNAVIFEGTTADAHETTLTSIDATGDRTISLPNVSGTIPVLAAASATAITSTPEELNILDGVTSTAAELNILDGVTSTAAELNALDGITAVVGELNALDIGSTAVGTAVASKAVILDSNKDYTGVRNFTLSGELDAGSLDVSGNADIDGTLETDALSINGTTVTSTAAELNALDGITAVVGELNALDIGSTAVGTAVASKAVILDSNKDYTGVRNLTISGELDAATLDISGNVDIDGVLETDNLTIGGAQGSDGQVLTSTGSGVGWEDAGSGATFKTFGTSSIMIGDDATGTIDAADNNTGVGVDIFAALTTGDRNTTMGTGSMAALTTGANNVGYGAYNLASITTSNGNTAIGYQTQQNGDGGEYNVSVGYRAGRELTSGDNNVAIGAYALDTNTTGHSNVAIGHSALTENTTALGNTAVGFQCMDANTTGNESAALGYNALGAHTTGNSNVGVGFEGGTGITTGTNDTCVGRSSGATITTGTRSTAIGSFAMGSTNAKTGDSNTVMGYSAGAVLSSGSSNTLIGDSAGDAITSGSQNTAVGMNALGANTTVAGNTAVGYRAAMTNTTGTKITAIGESALRLCATGNDNTAVGTGAGEVCLGSANVWIGKWAGISATNADNNTAVGSNALKAQVATHRNVAIGTSASDAVTSGANNVAVGVEANGCTTGSNNTCIGDLAGDEITTSSNNAVLGAGASISSATSQGNEVVLGSGLTGIGYHQGILGGVNAVYNQGNSTSFGQTSDERIKKNIEDYTLGLDAINGIRTRTFDYRRLDEIPNGTDGKILNPNELPEGQRIGVIAQEIIDVLPSCVKEHPNSRLSITTDNILWTLINAVQELSTQVDELKSKIGE